MLKTEVTLALFFLVVAIYFSDAKIVFEPDRGLYTDSVTVTLTETTGACVKYSVNSDTNPLVDGVVYSIPIPISSTSWIQAVLCTSVSTTDVKTHTYVFNTIEQWLTQTSSLTGWPDIWTDNVNGGTTVTADYEMDPTILNDSTFKPLVLQGFQDIPIVCLTLPLASLWDISTGIYTNADASDSSLFEKETSMEWFEPSGTLSFSERCGLRPQGGSTTGSFKNIKFSFRLSFKKVYGSGTLSERIFDDAASTSINTLVLDGRGNNVWTYGGSSGPTGQRQRAQYTRDQFVSDVYRAMSPYQNHTPRGRKVHLLINDDSFSESYLGGDKLDYDCIKHGGPSTVSGSRQPYLDMFTTINAQSGDALYNILVPDLVDVDSMVDYWLANVWAGNTDWDHNNYYACRNRVNGVWRWHSWDAEHTFENTPNRLNLNNNYGISRINQQLQSSTEWKVKVQDRVWAAFLSPTGALYVDMNNSSCSTGTNRPCTMYSSAANAIKNAVVCESGRWGDAERPGDPYTLNDWNTELNRLKSFFETWPTTFYNNLDNAGLFPIHNGVVLNINVIDSGSNNVNSEVVLMEWGTSIAGSVIFYIATRVGDASNISYMGADPRTNGGSVHANAVLYNASTPISLSAAESWHVMTRVYKDPDWGPLTHQVIPSPYLSNLRITEIHYHPANNGEWEFIEFQNIGSVAIPLAGVSVSGGIKYSFPVDVSLAPGAYYVITANTTAFQLQYGVTPSGEYSGHLSNGNELIQVYSPVPQLLYRIYYTDSAPYPVGADGAGYSLVVAVPDAVTVVYDDAFTYVLGTVLGGTPFGADGGIAPTSPTPSTPTAPAASPTTTPTSTPNTTPTTVPNTAPNTASATPSTSPTINTPTTSPTGNNPTSAVNADNGSMSSVTLIIIIAVVTVVLIAAVSGVLYYRHRQKDPFSSEIF